MFLLRETESRPVDVREFLDHFQEVEIQPEWQSDILSSERFESACNLVRLLEQPISRLGIRELKGIETRTSKFKDEWRCSNKTSAVRIAESEINGRYVSLESNLGASYREGRILPDMAVKTCGQSGNSRQPFESWLVPIEDKRVLELSVFAANRTIIEPLIGNHPASRSDVESALNKVGSYFKSVYEHKRLIQRDSLQQRLIANDGIVGSLARTAFRLVA